MAQLWRCCCKSHRESDTRGFRLSPSDHRRPLMDQPPLFGSVLDVEMDRASCHTGPSLDKAEWRQWPGHKPGPGTVRVSADNHYLLVSSRGTVIDRTPLLAHHRYASI